MRNISILVNNVIAAALLVAFALAGVDALKELASAEAGDRTAVHQAKAAAERLARQ